MAVVGTSSAARFFAVNGALANRVRSMGAKSVSRGNRIMQSGMGGQGRKGIMGHAGTAQALTGRAIIGAGQYAQTNPRAAAGIAGGAVGLGGIGMRNRRGSQNYPMY